MNTLRRNTETFSKTNVQNPQMSLQSQKKAKIPGTANDRTANYTFF